MRGAGDRRAWERGRQRHAAGARCVKRLQEVELAGVRHGRFDGIDQGRGAVVNGGHADAERLRVVQPAGDVVDGAERQVEPEPGADGVGDGLGDHFADVPRHPGARVMRHRVGELVGEGRGHVGAGAIGADPDRRGVMEVVAVAVGAGERIAVARGNGQIERAGVGEHGLPDGPGEGLVAAGRVALGRLPGVGVTGVSSLTDRDADPGVVAMRVACARDTSWLRSEPPTELGAYGEGGSG